MKGTETRKKKFEEKGKTTTAKSTNYGKKRVQIDKTERKKEKRSRQKIDFCHMR